MIEAFRVGAVSRGRTLWEGLDLAAGDGEAWIVAGPPACGKTLLMQILRGERRPDSGDVLVGGESLFRGSPESRKRFRASSGAVPESILEGGGKTVGDLFRLSALAAGGMPAGERRQRTEELLRMVGLPGAEDVPVLSLSVSERTRASLAVELLRSPRYLFLDMVLANAGKEWEEMLGSLFRALAKEERTIIMMERTIPDRWQGAKGGPAVSAGPFTLSRVAAPAAERKGPGASPESPQTGGAEAERFMPKGEGGAVPGTPGESG